jgi:hypothetical protein
MNATANKNSIPDRVKQWWGETDFRQMELITGFRQLDFEPDEGYQAFVDACDNCWERFSDEIKIRIWEQYS